MKHLVPSLFALALSASACTDSIDPADEPAADPQPRLEVGMTATIPPGDEVQYCRFVTVPETWVTHDTVEFTPGSHHIVVFQTPYASIPTQRLDGTPVDTSGVFDCSRDLRADWAITKVIGGSQNQGGESLLAFPEGVGVRLGGVLLVNVHYRNAGDAPLAAEAKVKFETTSADRITQEGDVLFLYNPLISVPPGGTASARWRCPVYKDITIVNAQSHMHARGVGYAARVDSGAPFYTTDRWEDVPVQSYEHLAVAAGSTLDFRCDYRNTSGAPIYQGLRTTDEMCMLVGSYYPADPRTANCLDETGKLPGGEWIGQGTASCSRVMACLQLARTLPEQTDCMLAASPAVSRESSELFRCFTAASDPARECAAQISACAAR